MARVVYVLGAGFSRPAGGPLLREMLDTSLKANREAVGPLWRTDEFQVLNSLLRTLPPVEQNIEGLFNAVSSGQLYGDEIGGYRPRDLLNFLIDYVAALVQGRIGNPSRKKVYRDFRDNSLSESDIAVVTFNYDLVADGLLMEAQGGLDYGLPVAPRKYRYFRLRGARQGPPLLKLHGSLSWLVCASCHHVWMHDTYAAHKVGRPCLRSVCPGRLRTLIVPPMWNKEPAAREIGTIWEAARGELLEARHVIVIGFSFPALDRAAIDLIRAVFRDNRRARLDIHNGPNYDYDSLALLLGKNLAETGRRLDDLVT